MIFPLLMVAAPVAVALEQQVILPADGPYALTLKNLRGRVVAKGWNKNVIYVHAVKRETHALAGQEAELAANVKVVLKSPAEGEVEVSLQAPGAGNTPSVQAARLPHVQVDYEVLVPPDCAVTIEQEYGAVAIVGVKGNVRAFSRDGDLTLSEIGGWAEATNERGALTFNQVEGDAVGKSFHGNLKFRAISGDIKATTSDGNVWVDVPVRWVGEISYQTVSGDFRSDLSTQRTTLKPGDKGYRGILRGPLAGHEAPGVRYTIDTTSGDATVASERQVAR